MITRPQLLPRKVVMLNVIFKCHGRETRELVIAIMNPGIGGIPVLGFRYCKKNFVTTVLF